MERGGLEDAEGEVFGFALSASPSISLIKIPGLC